MSTMAFHGFEPRTREERVRISCTLIFDRWA